MAEYTPHQKKIIENYYERRDEIMLNRLSELVTELYLVETDKRREQLWKRAETAMKQLKVKPSIVAHILVKRQPEILASHVQDWMKKQAGSR